MRWLLRGKGYSLRADTCSVTTKTQGRLTAPLVDTLDNRASICTPCEAQALSCLQHTRASCRRPSLAWLRGPGPAAQAQGARSLASPPPLQVCSGGVVQQLHVKAHEAVLARQPEARLEEEHLRRPGLSASARMRSRAKESPVLEHTRLVHTPAHFMHGAYAQLSNMLSAALPEAEG